MWTIKTKNADKTNRKLAQSVLRLYYQSAFGSPTPCTACRLYRYDQKIEHFSSGEDFFGLLYYFTIFYLMGLTVSFAGAIFLFLPQHYALQYFGFTHYIFYLIAGGVAGYLLQLLMHEELYDGLWQFRYLIIFNFLLQAMIFRYQAAKP